MLRRRSIELGLWAVAVAAPLASVSCTDDGVALHIECNVAPAVSDTGCTWDAASKECVFEGRMNLRAATSYYAGFKVRSGLRARTTRSPPRAEPNGVQLQRAEVELRRVGGSKLNFRDKDFPNPYTLESSGYVLPGATGLLQLELVPTGYVDKLREFETDPDKDPLGQIVAAVKIRGVTDGQTDVESADFLWPIRLLYKSPVVSDKECIESSIVCSSLRGVDAFAEACLCEDRKLCDLD